MKKPFGLFAIASLLFFGFASEIFAQSVASALLREGEVIPGTMGNVATAINNSATNGFGGFSFTLTADDNISMIWGSLNVGPPTVLRLEGPLAGLTVTGFESFFGMSDTGRFCYGTTADNPGTGATGLDGVFLNDMLLLNEDEPVADIPGTFSTFNSRPGVTANGIPYWVGGITEKKGGGTDARVLFMGTDATALLMSGDSISGVAEPIGGSGIDFNLRMSHCGTNYIMASFLDGGDDVLHINGEALTTDGAVIRTGVEIPESVGGIGDSFDNFDFFGVSENGSYMATGDSDGNTATDEFVMIDGQIVLREGDSIGSGTLAGAIEAGFRNEDGDWAVVWDANLGAANLEVLIFNGDVILTEGDLVDWNGDGVIDTSDDGAVIDNFTGINSLTMSRVDATGTLRMYFTADVDVNGEILEGGFVVETAGNSILLGDVNADGNVNLLDVSPFVKAIQSGTYVPAADINSDNDVNLLDVDPFITELGG